RTAGSGWRVGQKKRRPWPSARADGPGAPLEQLGRGALALAVALLEPVHPTADVHDLLLAGVERVAGRADLGVQLAGLGGAAGGEGVATRAGHLGDDVLG